MATYDTDNEKPLTRLRRIEGQTRGLQRMVEEDKYCVDIMTQITSVQAALVQVSLVLMENYLHHESLQEIKLGFSPQRTQFNNYFVVFVPLW